MPLATTMRMMRTKSPEIMMSILPNCSCIYNNVLGGWRRNSWRFVRRKPRFGCFENKVESIRRMSRVHLPHWPSPPSTIRVAPPPTVAMIPWNYDGNSSPFTPPLSSVPPLKSSWPFFMLIHWRHVNPTNAEAYPSIWRPLDSMSIPMVKR